MMPIDHLGIAVRKLDETIGRFAAIGLGPSSAPELVESQRVRVSFVPAGESHIEFLEPTDPDGPVGRFLSQRGEGLHHVAFRVPNVDQALETVRATGGRTVDATGRAGARGRRVGFAHPAAFSGTLVEFVEGP